MNKKIIAAVLSVLMALEGITVFAGIQSDMPQGMTPSQIYVYENFDSGDNFFYTKEKGFIYEWYTQKPRGWYYGTNSNKTFSWLGSEDDGYFGYSGVGTSGGVIDLLSNDYQASESNMFSNRLLIDDWENFDGSFVVSYDFLLPMQNTESYSNCVYLTHYANEKQNSIHYAAQFPTLLVKDGEVYADTYASEEWRSKAPTSIVPTNIRISNAAPGEWANVTMVLTRVPGSKRYSAISYINGMKVSVCNMDPAVNSTDWTSFERANAKQDSGFGLRIRSRTPDGEWLGIDNICYRVYSKGTDMQSVVTVDSGASIARIPVTNIELEDTEAPYYAKQGIVDLENASVTAKRYAADDKFFVNGSSVDISFNLDKSERYSAVAVAGGDGTEDGVWQAVGLNGTEIAVNIPSDLDAGERLVLEFEGIKDITGKEIKTKRVVIYTNDTFDAGILSISATDFFDNDVEIDVNSDWDTSIKTFSLETIDIANCYMRLLDGETEIATTEFSNGVYTFTLNDGVVLTGGKTYTITKEGEEYLSFTVKDGEIKYGEMSMSGGCLTVPYLNTTEVSEKVGFIACAKDDDGVVLDIVCEEKSVDALKFGEISNETALQNVTNAKAIIVDNLTYKNAVENSNVINTSEFDEKNIITVKGALGLSNTAKEAKLVVLKKDLIGEEDANIYNAVVNATSAEIDENGEYTAKINFTDFRTGRYIIELFVGDSVYKMEKFYGTEAETKIALGLLNSATQALGETEGCVQYILNQYEEVLELDYYVYKALNSNENVAKYVFAYIDSQRKNDNNTPFETKQQFSSIFRQAAVAAAINQGAIVETIEDVEEYIECLETMPVSDWYNYREDIDKSRTESWRDGLLSRMHSYAKGKYSNLDEFNKIVQDCMVLEVVKNPGTVSNLMLCMNDFAYVAGFDSDLIKQKVVSKVSGKTYSGCTLADLKKDMVKANQSNKYEGSDKGSGSDRVSGGTVSISSSLVINDGKEPIGTIEPEINYAFDDIKSVSWAVEAIETLAEKGIISGKGDGKFYPNDNITREEFTKLIVELFKLETNDTEFGFDDVSGNDWCYDYVKAAYQNKIISGIGNGLFGRGKNITRQDAAVIIHNALKQAEYNLSVSEEASFTDEEMFADYALESIKMLSGIKVINGYADGSFGPNENLTRAEAAKLIYGLIGYVGI